MNKLKFRVKYKFSIDGVERSGIEEESSWYLIDQRGNFYTDSPMGPVLPIHDNMYSEIIPLIKIGKEYLSVSEIEERIKCQ